MRTKRKYRLPVCPECGTDRNQLKEKILKGDTIESVTNLISFTNCDSCKTDMSMLYRKVTDICDICGARLEDHDRCLSCGIYAGPGHAIQSLTNGYCYQCYKAKGETNVS